VHLMLDDHQIVWANGVECESFHPASARLDQIDGAQRSSLLERFPDIGDDPYSYGDHARRNLSGPEAEILAHGMSGRH
ncbi:MAG: hemolysin-type calcium-binding protein, partial [Paracoccaceae bacterium]